MVLKSDDRDAVSGRLEGQTHEDPERKATIDDAKQALGVSSVGRDDQRRKNAHWLSIAAIWILGLAIIVMLLVLFFNMAASDKYRFLSPEEMFQLQEFLFSGTIGTIGGYFLRNITGRNSE